MTMPGNVGSGPGSFFGGNLTAYVQNQTISEDRVKDMAVSLYLYQTSSFFEATVS